MNTNIKQIEQKEFYNSQELTKKVSHLLKLNEKEEQDLYDQLSALSDGPVKRALNDLIKKIKQDLNSMSGCKPKINGMEYKNMEMEYKYAACMKAGSVPNSEMPLFIDIIKASTPTRAKQIAASRAGVSEDAIELVQVQ